MTRVIWREAARTDLAELHALILEHNPAAADEMVLRIIRHSRMLEAMPSLGRPGRVSGTRELVVPRTAYILPYWRLGPDEIEILAMIHGARRWPEDLA